MSNNSIVAIILAAGKATRMGSTHRQKVCLPVDGRPVINRAIDTYQACGIQQHIVVVGDRAEQVMATVAQIQPGVIFAYQVEQRGTGHAAKQGAEILERLDYTGAVLVVAGDKVIKPVALRKLICAFRDGNWDLAFLVGPRQRWPSAGRIVTDAEGIVLACIEQRDVQKKQALEQIRNLALEYIHNSSEKELAPAEKPLRAQALEILKREMLNEKKAAIAFGQLWQLLHQNTKISSDQLLELIPEEETYFQLWNPHQAELIKLKAQEVDQFEKVNLSVYLFKASVLHYALTRIRDDNAQREEYLTDAITILAQTRAGGRPRFRVKAVEVEDPDQVLTFNTPGELQEIEGYFRSKRSGDSPQRLTTNQSLRPIDQWMTAFQDLLDRSIHSTSQEGDEHKSLREELLRTYTDTLLPDRSRAWLYTLEDCRKKLGGTQSVLLVRAPGRVNIMGRHVDHQGGHCNLMTIDREILMAVHPRKDDRVHLHSVNPSCFSQHQFSISELVADLPEEDWLSLVDSEKVQKMVAQASGDWAQYVKAAILKLQKEFPARKFRGMDLIVYGDIPLAAGLSSSSALVVASAEAAVAVNGLELSPEQLVDLCSQGEWFVGTRGGAADHAAIKLGRRGAILHVKFFDFEVEEIVPFPEGYYIVICDSQVKAQKSAKARQIFNQRVACYRIGVKLTQKIFPQYAPWISHLRDINYRNLGVSLSEIYRILLKLPEQASYQELIQLLGPDELEPLIASHDPTREAYPIRGVVLYGLAECERSRGCLDFLKTGDIFRFGELMCCSHNGDRVVSYDEAWHPVTYFNPVSDDYLLKLIEDLESGDPSRIQAAQLERQPGTYACSTPEIDLMVDIALRTEEVLGAQLAGAGLGGSMMALVSEKGIEPLQQNLTEIYYKPRGLEPTILICRPIEGSGVLGANF